MTTEIPELYRSALATFGDRVHGVTPDQWQLPTPCAEWDVRTLVNHVVGENLWAVPLFAGGTIAEVGDRFDGDVLGDGPVAAWDSSAAAAIVAVDDPGAMDRIVHLSFGDFPGSEYAMQLFADLLIHGWDLARATGQPEGMATDEITACAEWFAGVRDGYRAGGVVADRPDVPATADAQTRLLADFGRVAVAGT